MAELADLLGRGLNLFSLDPWSTPNLEQIVSGGVVTDDPILKTSLKTFYGSSLLDISHKIAVEAGVSGSYGGFSASVDATHCDADPHWRQGGVFLRVVRYDVHVRD